MLSGGSTRRTSCLILAADVIFLLLLFSAIANYTQRVVSTTLSNTEVNYALRFLVHFVGDIHQPLHDEALEIGGNDIDVTFAGALTNLHHI